MVRLEVEARGSSGVLSRLFGQNAGDVSRQLASGGLNPQQANTMYQDVLDLSEDT